MAGYSARQSSFTTGDTITAAHSNDEFNQVLAAFNATTGHTHDGTAGEGGPVGSIRDADSLNKILVDSTNNHLEFYVEVSSSAVQQFRIQDGAIVPITDNDIDLGTSSLEFKDLYIDGTAYVDAINYNGTAISSTAAELNILDGVTSTAAELNIIDGDTSATSTTIADADRVVLNDAGTMKQVAVTDLSAYFDDEITAMPNLTSVGTLTTLTVDNIIINGTNIGHTSDADALAIDSSGNVTASQNLVVTGDLTVSGDDITMGTNTAGNLLVADGTNFNSIAVGSLSEISTVADDDVFLAVDTSGGGLKKIARSAVVSGLATSSAISNLADDSTPQLGGSLDVNGEDIVSTSNGNITLTPNGSGVVRLDGNVDIQTGLIDLKNGGTVSKIKFYCESSNAHAQTLQSAPHSAASSAVLTLPTATGTLIGTGDTGTLPLASIDIDGGTDIGAAIVDADLFIIDDGAGGTNRKVTASRLKTYAQTGVSSAADDITAGDGAVNITTTSGSITIDAAANDTDIIFKGTDNSSDITMLTLDGSEAGAATFNNKVIATELDISGDVDVDGTLEADAITVDGTTLAEFISDTAGAMFSSNTETGITATYQDGDNTIDLALDAAQTTITSLLATDIKIGEDDQTKIDFETADTIHFYAGNQNQLKLTDGVLAPVTDNDVDLGTSSLEFKNVYVDGTVFADALGFGTVVMTLPTADGSANQILTTDGSGTLSFVDNSGGTEWQAVKTSNFTASAGQGIFANTSGGSFTVTLPASPSLGDEVSIKDYAGTFDTNALTIGRNSQPIEGVAEDLTVSVERAGFTLAYSDSTQGWLLKDK